MEGLPRLWQGQCDMLLAFVHTFVVQLAMGYMRDPASEQDWPEVDGDMMYVFLL
jgi:hypothetical protein